jgi:hypothetical protein
MKVKSQSKKSQQGVAQRPCERPLRQAGPERGLPCTRCLQAQGDRRAVWFHPVRVPPWWIWVAHQAPGASTCAGACRPRGRLRRGAQWRHHRAGHPAHGADRGRCLPAGGFPRSRGAGATRRLALQGRPVDVVVSDMAPNLSGHCLDRRHAHCTHLVELAVDFRVRAPASPKGRIGRPSCSMAAGYEALVQLFRETVSRWSNRSSRRPRATNPPKPFW